MTIDLSDLESDDIEAEYHRNHIDRCRLGELAELVAETVANPTDDVEPGDRNHSFYLHAPLEFMARMELMTSLHLEDDTASRVQLLALGVRCARLGPPAPPPRDRALGTARSEAGALLVALEDGDRDQVDEIAHGLDTPGGARHLVGDLAPFVATSLEAASHGIIYLQYLHLLNPAVQNTAFLRRMLRELAVSHEHRRIPEPPERAVLNDRLTVLPSGREHLPRTSSIADAFVLVQEHGLLEPWSCWARATAVPPQLRIDLQRLAASAMIFGADSDVQFGWTHALSIPQATLDIAAEFGPACGPSMTYAAISHLAVSWYSVERQPLTVANRTVTNPWKDDHFRALARRSLASEDAHRVKYLICARRAREVDPGGAPIYATAANRLDEWWEQRTTHAD